MKTLSICIVLLMAISCVAQEKSEPRGIFESPEEYDQFMGNAKRIAYGPEGNRELQAMIPMLNDIVLQQPIGATASQYNTQASTLGLLADKNVRADLEMVDDQYETLQRVSQQIRERTADQLRSIDFTSAGTFADQIRKIRDEANEELDSLLLPHQLKRLKQIRLQSQLKQRRLVDILTSAPTQDDLNISSQQSKELRRAQEKIDEEVRKEILAIQERARNKLLANLNPTQQAEVKEMIGDSFDFGPPQKRERGKQIRRKGKLKK